LPAARIASRTSGKQVSAIYLHLPVALTGSEWQVLHLPRQLPAQHITIITITYKRKCMAGFW